MKKTLTTATNGSTGARAARCPLRKGFTVIEVILFFAISGFLIVGLLIGMTSSIARQRYVDSVQDFADFLRGQYYAVSNPEHTLTDTELSNLRVGNGPFGTGFPGCNFTAGRGQTRCSVFGRLIVIGEDPNNSGNVTTYMVLGIEREEYTSTDPLNRILTSYPLIPDVGLTDSYSMQWGAVASGTVISSPPATPSVYPPTPISTHGASILIIRPPGSQTVRTFILESGINVGAFVNSFHTSYNDPTSLLSSYFDPTVGGLKFQERQLDICIGSSDDQGRQRSVRLLAGGSNPSAVEVVSETDGNPCIAP
jgi:hypothetical protein